MPEQFNSIEGDNIDEHLILETEASEEAKEEKIISADKATASLETKEKEKGKEKKWKRNTGKFIKGVGSGIGISFLATTMEVLYDAIALPKKVLDMASDFLMSDKDVPGWMKDIYKKMGEIGSEKSKKK